WLRGDQQPEHRHGISPAREHVRRRGAHRAHGARRAQGGAMKVVITDVRAISALSPTALTAYLRARGWSAVESDAAFAVFERPGDEEKVGLDVPLRPSAGDYAPLCQRD